VPEQLEDYRYLDSINPETGKFDSALFWREMWPVFEKRIFRDHPRLEDIRKILKTPSTPEQELFKAIPLELTAAVVKNLHLPYETTLGALEEIAAKPVSPQEEQMLLHNIPAIPDIARGHENIYLSFLNGKLTYRPTPGSDDGKIELLIRDIMDPNTLEGRFDLSRCVGVSELSINTGYRKERNPENIDKLEVWITPRFLIERKLSTTASQFSGIMTSWPEEAAIGIFYNYGDWEDLFWFEYVINNPIEQLGNDNLYEKWRTSRTTLKSKLSDGTWAYPPGKASVRRSDPLPGIRAKNFMFSF
jgi:hypothetical protein